MNIRMGRWLYDTNSQTLYLITKSDTDLEPVAKYEDTTTTFVFTGGKEQVPLGILNNIITIESDRSNRFQKVTKGGVKS